MAQWQIWLDTVSKSHTPLAPTVTSKLKRKKMNTDKWNEICFLLSENVQKDINENSFEQNVILALRVLDWKEYLGDFDIRPSFQIGAANKITPDFVIKSADKQKLFVIEIKQPNIPLNSRFQQQLFSYMRQLKLEYGILIGQGIQIFYDGYLAKQEDPVLLDTIKFERDSEKGEKFVELFCKGNFNSDSLKEYTLQSLKKINRKEDFKTLTNKISTADFKENIWGLIKQELITEYDGELIDSVLNELELEIKNKNKTEESLPIQTRQTAQPKESIYSSTILPIELNPNNESEFKRKLLLNKRAFITTMFANGTKQKKIWNANRFRESSGVLGNLRSRPEFRNGEWQKRGIIKVFVSIEE